MPVHDGIDTRETKLNKQKETPIPIFIILFQDSFGILSFVVFFVAVGILDNSIVILKNINLSGCHLIVI